jgi:ABC-2 type transport system permease protein
MLGRIRHMLVKEFIQVFRDKRTRFTLFGPPVVQMLIFGYAATLDIRHVPTAVLDLDNTQESRDLISRFAASQYFDVRAHLQDRRQIGELIDRDQVLLAVQINAGFAQDLRKGQTAPVQVIVDSSNSNTALVDMGYVSQVAAAFAGDYQTERLARTAPFLTAQMPSVELERRPWFNEDLQSRWYFVPGVIGNLTTVMVVMLTAFAVVREREIGTLEQIMVTPIRRVEFILGKTLPFYLIGLMDVALVSLVGTLWFRVPFRGHVMVLVFGAAVYLLCMVGIGLLLSTLANTQQQAMVAGFFFMMPTIIFSGFGTPISSMPRWLQLLDYGNPLRYFMVVLRGVYLKGVGLDVLWPQIVAMAALGVVMLTVSVLRFQKSLD